MAGLYVPVGAEVNPHVFAIEFRYIDLHHLAVPLCKEVLPKKGREVYPLRHALLAFPPRQASS